METTAPYLPRLQALGPDANLSVSLENDRGLQAFQRFGPAVDVCGHLLIFCGWIIFDFISQSPSVISIFLSSSFCVVFLVFGLRRLLLLA
jgi:hypothetical protein